MQKLSLFSNTYDIIDSKTNLSRDPQSKVQTLWARCCIPADNIAEISPWVMEGKGKTDLTLRTTWHKDDGSFHDAVSYTFHDAICTEYWEAYSQKLNQTCLWFCYEAEAITVSKASEEEALKRLFE